MEILLQFNKEPNFYSHTNWYTQSFVPYFGGIKLGDEINLVSDSTNDLFIY